MTESLLDFYRRNQISPVRQDIRDLRAHFARRTALYRHLGILPAFVRGRSVLEIGPGSGFNSIHTAALEPSRYVMLEGNPQGVEDIRHLFAGFPELAEHVEVICGRAEDYRPVEPFEFVFCEGMLALAGVPQPERLLQRVAECVAPGGVLVITCIDAVSDLSETLRRFIADLLIDPAESIGQSVERLLPVFAPHLSTLSGMSRRYDDWIVDNLINPASIGPLLSMSDAVQAIDGEFDVFGSSPKFLSDWRWYKSITSADGGFNHLAIEEYWANVHNLLDYRRMWPPRDPRDNRSLYETCAMIRGAVHGYELDRDRQVVATILAALDAVVRNVCSFSTETSDALSELQEILSHPSIDVTAFAGSRRFGPLFGRGQQYLSFNKRVSPVMPAGAGIRD